VPQDIRNRRLLLLCFRLSGGQLRHRCRSPAYHVLDQTSQNSRLTRLETLKHVIYLGDYYRNVLILASVLRTLGYVFIRVHLTIINVDSTAAF
jgi:hypothetical protein